MKHPLNSDRAWHRAAAMLALLLALGGAAQLCAESYTITDLGTLGGFGSDAFAANNLGHVAGAAMLPDGNLHGFFRDSTLHDVGPLSGNQSHAFDLNAADQVAAMSYSLGELVTHGILWQAGTPTNLGNIAPRGVNAAGQVVGYVSTLDPAFGWVDRAALWQNGVIYDLGTLGGHFSYGYAISDDGWVVGMSFTTGDTGRRATLWQGGVPRDLGTLGGSTSHAYDISPGHAVVGVADTATGEAHAFRFVVDAGGNVTARTDLGTLGGGYSYAYATNAGGQVVGTSNGAAFLWQNGNMTDLNTLLPPASGWRLDIARDVNDRGQIVGVGLHAGQPRGFLLTPGLVGDLNCDGAVDFGDITPFVMALSDPAGYAATYPDCDLLNGDINGDGVLNFGDISPFVALLSGN